MVAFKNFIKLFSADKKPVGSKEKCSVQLSVLINILVQELKEKGQDRSAKAYQSVLNNILAYTGGADIYLEDITEVFLLKYEVYLHRRRSSPGTISFYMRNLRAIYNKGIKKGLHVPSSFSSSLFDKVYTETPPPVNPKSLVDDKKREMADKELQKMYQTLHGRTFLPEHE